MKAPDRIWISADELGRKVDTFLCSSDSYYADNLGEVEYIRRGAFPVEELREALDDRYGPETAVAFRAEYKLMERILSLLESDE